MSVEQGALLGTSYAGVLRWQGILTTGSGAVVRPAAEFAQAHHCGLWGA